MNEIFEQINHYKWVLFHNCWIMLASTILICLVGWTVVQSIPDKFQSETRIYIDTETVLKSLLSGIAVDSSMREHAARVMQHTLLVRPNLEKVVRETDLNLAINESDPEQIEKLLSQLARDIRISSESITRNDSSNIYSISYLHTNPQMAKDVVEVLLNIFIETILGTGRKDNQQAQEFVDNQVAIYARKQNEAEDRLKKFKQENAGIMMEEGNGIYSRINALETRIQETELSLNEAENRTRTLQAQIASLRDRSSNSPSSPEIAQTPLESRIESMETRLDELLLKYTEQHPDIISTRRVLEQMREQKQVQEEGAEEPQANQVSPGLQNSTLYQELNILLGETQAETSALRARLDEYRRRRTEMNNQLSTLPEVEAQLVSLNRDYEVTKELYEQLVMRQQSLQLSSEAGQTGEEMQFRVLEQPMVPVSPVSPNRILLSTLVLLAAIVAGIGLAIVYELIRPTIYSKRQLVENIELPVLGVVSMFWNDEAVSKRRQRFIMFNMSLVILFISYGGLLVHNGLDPGVTTFINRLIE
ncbi:polysaccharide chain length determinant protein (PEP-CTERM system associated) [Methylohalomonas lacus]|uniref:Polysaccharide chain length determinant protein (PEP-CTERM system associated) n=1 Tax=Methylohalomonas lacus TaxID=398773 RepID=A0AAE3HP08_9GAMM|nr:XrtA system polysaccharide chain length determinant [Methylohalomonas lacus]MCS3904337.1 polysaccharide chain length determinant protein (PEP-CTERM system associated) [Methylohalomonas lacus]